MKKGFTLIELLLVLVIVSVVLGIAFNISGQRVTELKIRNEISQFQKSYNNTLSQILSSSYIGDFRYSSQTTIIQSGANNISYVFSGNGNNNITETFHFSLQNIISISPDSEELIILSKPNKIGCIINNNEEILTGGFILESNQIKKTRCFSIDTNTCKLKINQCPSEI